MARRRYRKRKRSRKMIRRRKRPRRIPVLLGKHHVCQHKLVVANQMLVDAVAGLVITQTIRANSAALPVVGSTQQPNGFAEMNSLFRKHTVIGSKATLTALPSDGQHSRAFYMTKELTNRFAQPAFGLNQILASRYTRYCVYSPSDGTGWKPRVTQKCSVKKFLNLKDIRDNDQVSGEFSDGLPERIIYYNYAASPTHQPQALQVCDVIMQVTYSVLYSDPITPSFT